MSIKLTNSISLVRLLLTALGLISTCDLAGCATSGETVAVAAAGATGAIYLGSQAATHSKIEVKVEVYDQSAQKDQHPEHFLQNQPMALAKVGTGLSKESLIQIALRLSPIMAAIQSSLPQLRNAGSNYQLISGDLNKLADQQQQAFDDWKKFNDSVIELGKVENPTVDQLEDGATLLLKFRDSLQAYQTFKFSADFLGQLENIFTEPLIEASNASRPTNPKDANADALQKAQQEYHDLAAKLTHDTNATDYAEQLAPYVAASIVAAIEKIPNQTQKDQVLSIISQYLSSFAISESPDKLKEAYINGDNNATVDKLVVQFRSDTLLSTVLRQRDLAYQATFNQLDTDFNLGGIRNEVMQTLLTSDAIPDITDKKNEGNWRPFSHACSEGTVGNHDVVIYFENLGLPILKSSAFDPSKFIIANGEMFRKAFTSIASVYGVPTSYETNPLASSNPGSTLTSGQPSGSSSTSPTTASPVISYNISLAEQSRQTAIKTVNDNQTKILAALKALTDADDAAKGEPTADKARTDASSALQKIIDGLGK